MINKLTWSLLLYRLKAPREVLSNSYTTVYLINSSDKDYKTYSMPGELEGPIGDLFTV